jgi:hypothetical protein
VLVYHAIAFCIPSLGGIAAYWRPRCRLRDRHPEDAEHERRARPKPVHGPSFGEPCGARRAVRDATRGSGR